VKGGWHYLSSRPFCPHYLEDRAVQTPPIDEHTTELTTQRCLELDQANLENLQGDVFGKNEFWAKNPQPQRPGRNGRNCGGLLCHTPWVCQVLAVKAIIRAGMKLDGDLQMIYARKTVAFLPRIRQRDNSSGRMDPRSSR